MDIAKLFEGVDPRHLAKGRSDYVPLGWKATPLQLAFSIVPNELVLYGGPLVLSTPVLTPIGFRPLKEIRVGDTVFTRHGEPTKVVDIPFEGKEESYRIQFSDDTFITASAGHKWLVGTSDWRKTKNEFRVKRTKDLLDYKLSRNRNKYYVPQTKPVEFESKPVPLDPYFIGAMLGDGCMTKRCNMTLTGIDREIVDNFDLPEGYTAKPVKGCPQWKFTKGYCKGPSDCSSVIWDGIAELGLAGVRSHTKFIPEEYLFNDVETRLSVLRGLMDTDGTVRDGSAAEMVYCTVSSQLRDDFVFLAQSLGFIVRVSEEEKPPYSTIYRIRLSGSSLCPFRLSRKVKRWRKSDRRSDGIKHIVKITPVGKKKVRCITVEDPDHTFLVRNFTVTKNSAGGGKVLYDDGVVLSPSGYKRGIDLHEGDLISSPDGKTSRIVQLHPRKMFTVWRVKFHDGTHTDVSEEHLWLSWKSGSSRKSSQVIETRTLKEQFDNAAEQKAEGKRPQWPLIPLAGPQEFTEWEEPKIDPYWLGFWLGDGSFARGVIRVTSDEEDWNELSQYLPPDCSYATSTKRGTTALDIRFIYNSYQDWKSVLAHYGLVRHKAHEKFIPEEIKWGSIETRLHVLQGLMDTDGTVDSRGQCYFCSISKQLAEDVRFIVQSLGGTATVFEKEPFYRDANGTKVYGQRAYSLYIKLPGFSLFRLSRKAKRSMATPPLYRRVVGVEVLKEKRYGRCITVSHPSGLYLTNDFIVTHNSEAVLFAAQQYVHIKGYKAIIYRKSYQDLVRSGALLDRAMEWWGPWLGNGIKYIPQDHKFVWLDSGAQVSFGYMGKKGSKDTMQGAEYHAIFIDEVTQHNPSDIGYALSRLRRKASEDIPLRARFTANPGGIGHKHVFDMFKMVKNPNYDKNNPKSPMYIGSHPTHLFIPSRLADNPYIDQESYVKRLSNLDPLTRDRLLHGDWSASPFSRFKPEWFKRYKVNGPYFNTDMGPIERRQLSIFHTIDVAASQKEGVGGRQFYSNNSDTIDVMDALANADPCWTVVATWGIFGNKLFLLDVQRKQTEIPEVFDMMKYAQNRWGIHTFGVEKNGVGAGVVQMGARMGFMVEEIWTHKDKITNSYEANTMANQGNVYIPEQGMQIPGYEWLDDWENEIFTWMGLKDETSDQVDAFSMAAKKVAHFCINHVDYRGRKPNTAVPKVYGVMNSDSSFGSSSAVFNPLGNPFNYE